MKYSSLSMAAAFGVGNAMASASSPYGDGSSISHPKRMDVGAISFGHKGPMMTMEALFGGVDGNSSAGGNNGGGGGLGVVTTRTQDHLGGGYGHRGSAMVDVAVEKGGTSGDAYGGVGCRGEWLGLATEVGSAVAAKSNTLEVGSEWGTNWWKGDSGSGDVSSLTGRREDVVDIHELSGWNSVLFAAVSWRDSVQVTVNSRRDEMVSSKKNSELVEDDSGEVENGDDGLEQPSPKSWIQKFLSSARFGGISGPLLIQPSILFNDDLDTNKAGLVDDGVESEISNSSSNLASPSSRAVIVRDEDGVSIHSMVDDNESAYVSKRELSMDAAVCALVSLLSGIVVIIYTSSMRTIQSAEQATQTRMWYHYYSSPFLTVVLMTMVVFLSSFSYLRSRIAAAAIELYGKVSPTYAHLYYVNNILWAAPLPKLNNGGKRKKKAMTGLSRLVVLACIGVFCLVDIGEAIDGVTVVSNSTAVAIISRKKTTRYTKVETAASKNPFNSENSDSGKQRGRSKTHHDDDNNNNNNNKRTKSRKAKKPKKKPKNSKQKDSNEGGRCVDNRFDIYEEHQQEDLFGDHSHSHRRLLVPSYLRGRRLVHVNNACGGEDENHAYLLPWVPASRFSANWVSGNTATDLWGTHVVPEPGDLCKLKSGPSVDVMYWYTNNGFAHMCMGTRSQRGISDECNKYFQKDAKWLPLTGNGGINKINTAVKGNLKLTLQGWHYTCKSAVFGLQGTGAYVVKFMSQQNSWGKTINDMSKDWITTVGDEFYLKCTDEWDTEVAIAAMQPHPGGAASGAVNDAFFISNEVRTFDVNYLMCATTKGGCPPIEDGRCNYEWIGHTYSSYSAFGIENEALKSEVASLTFALAATAATTIKKFGPVAAGVVYTVQAFFNVFTAEDPPPPPQHLNLDEITALLDERWQLNKLQDDIEGAKEDVEDHTLTAAEIFNGYTYELGEELKRLNSQSVNANSCYVSENLINICKSLNDARNECVKARDFLPTGAAKSYTVPFIIPTIMIHVAIVTEMALKGIITASDIKVDRDQRYLPLFTQDVTTTWINDRDTKIGIKKATGNRRLSSVDRRLGHNPPIWGDQDDYCTLGFQIEDTFEGKPIPAPYVEKIYKSHNGDCKSTEPTIEDAKKDVSLWKRYWDRHMHNLIPTYSAPLYAATRSLIGFNHAIALAKKSSEVTTTLAPPSTTDITSTVVSSTTTVGTTQATTSQTTQGTTTQAPPTSTSSSVASTTSSSNQSTSTELPPLCSSTSHDGCTSNQEPRCGRSEIDAREHCNAVCQVNTDCPSVDGVQQFCWGTHANYCGSFPKRTYSSPVQAHGLRCGFTEIHARTFCGVSCSQDSDCAFMGAGAGCHNTHTNYCGSDYTTDGGVLQIQSGNLKWAEYPEVFYPSQGITPKDGSCRDGNPGDTTDLSSCLKLAELCEIYQVIWDGGTCDIRMNLVDDFLPQEVDFDKAGVTLYELLGRVGFSCTEHSECVSNICPYAECSAEDCIDRCIKMYGGDGSSGDSYYCAKGCASMRNGQIEDPNKFCNIEQAERYSVCVNDCERASSDKDNQEHCSYGCKFWHVSISGYCSSKKMSRHVRVQLPGTELLHLSEVEVFAMVEGVEMNVANHTLTKQSSTYNNNDGVYGASKAVDGLKDYHSGYSHTKEEPGALWEADLGDLYHIKRVVIWQRQDCCTKRLTGATVSLLDDKKEVNQERFIGDSTDVLKFTFDFAE